MSIRVPDDVVGVADAARIEGNGGAGRVRIVIAAIFGADVQWTPGDAARECGGVDAEDGGGQEPLGTLAPGVVRGAKRIVAALGDVEHSVGAEIHLLRQVVPNAPR